MTYEEMVTLLQYNDKESNVYMPNEIFMDLQNNIKSAPQIGFAYSYLYLTQYLYRQAKYFNVSTVLDNSKIKEILGYSKSTKSLDFLIKKDGSLLDKIEYTESTRDYPISWEYSKEEDLQFFMSSEYGEFSDQLPAVPKRFFLKKPLKGFDRVLEVEDGEDEDIPGVFFAVENTHCIPFEVFMHCITNKEIGTTGFYLYCWIKRMNDFHEGVAYDVPLTKLSKETGISHRNLDKYMGLLKAYRMLDFTHNQDFFAIGLRKEDRKANSYYANEYFNFSGTPVPFNNIDIMKKEEYFKMLKEYESNNGIDFNLNELPF